jgi:hypothetical protein
MQRLNGAAPGPAIGGVGGRLLAFLVVATILAACGGGGADPSGSGAAASGAGGGNAGATDDTGTGSGNTGNEEGAPVTTTIDGVTFGHTFGSCIVNEDQVVAKAARLDFPGLAQVDARWLKDGGRETFKVVNTGGPDPKPPTPYDLRATPQDAGTTWDVAIDGSNAVITLRMIDLSPSGSGAFLDVTINIRCDQPAWGGAEPEPTDAGPVEPAPDPTAAGESTITLDLGGTTYTWTYPGCATDDAAGGFLALGPELNRLVVDSSGAATLNLPDGTAWTAQGVQLARSGGSATWTGSMTSASGSEQATLTIGC